MPFISPILLGIGALTVIPAFIWALWNVRSPGPLILSGFGFICLLVGSMIGATP